MPGIIADVRTADGLGLSGGFGRGWGATELVRRGAGRGHVGEPSDGCGTGVSRDPAASAVNGPALLLLDGKVGAEVQADDNVDVTGGGGSARLYRR